MAIQLVFIVLVELPEWYKSAQRPHRREKILNFYLNRHIFIGYRNNRYFRQTNPYKYANRSSHVTMQRSTYKELLIYRAWATCGLV